MIAILLCLGWPAGEDVPYAELSRIHGLAEADRLLKQEKYLEASVAYRNVLLQKGDSEAVRIPLALALFGHGDLDYAGTELRRAHLLYDRFGRVRIQPSELFASTTVLALQAESAFKAQKPSDPAERHAVLAYVFHLLGYADRALAACRRYAEVRAEDAFVRDLRGMIDSARGRTAAQPSVPPEVQRLERRVGQITGDPGTPLRVGSPVSAGARFHQPAPQPRGEFLNLSGEPVTLPGSSSPTKPVPLAGPSKLSNAD